MGHLEHTLLQQYKKPMPEIYKRYIDDGIGATSLSYDQLLDFINFVQNFHLSVKFTYEIFEMLSLFWTRKSPLNEENSLHPFSTNQLILFPTLTTAHLTTPVPKTASRSPSFLDFAICAQTMQTSKKKLRKWSTSFFKYDTPKTR